jgi:hypothetical protein
MFKYKYIINLIMSNNSNNSMLTTYEDTAEERYVLGPLDFKLYMWIILVAFIYIIYLYKTHEKKKAIANAFYY